MSELRGSSLAFTIGASLMRRRERVLWSFMKGLCVVVALVLVGCAEQQQPEVNGSSMMLNLTPANRLSVVGALDFELQDAGTGKACVDRYGSKQYWVDIAEVAKLAHDELTRQAIAAAVMDAISRLDDTDTILLTRVVTESKGPNRICASVVGRGIRLQKAQASGSDVELRVPSAHGD